MTRHDHELKIGTTTDQFTLIRDDNGVAMYQVIEEIPRYEPNLTFEQTNWINGHGQFEFEDKNAYFEGQSIDTTQDGRIFLGPEITEVQEHGSPDTDLDSAPVCFLWSVTATKWLVATAGEIYLYDPTDNDWDEATTEVTGVTDMKEFNGYIFAARGSLTAYVYSTNGTDWTTVDTLADLYAEHFFVSVNADGTANVLWKSVGNQLKSNTSGISTGAEWSSAAYIGDSGEDITNTFLINDELLIGKADNLYHYDSGGGLHPYMDDLKIARSTNNFKYVAYWQAGVYFSRGTGLGEITASATFDPMGPLTDIDDIGKVGVCVGLTADADWIYTAYDEGTNTHIYKMREVATSRGLKWQRCPWVFLGTEACATIAVCQHPTKGKMLWFGYGNSTGYVILTDNPTADSTARFCTSGFLRMSYTYGTDPNWDKLWQSAVIEQTRYNSGAETVASTGETVQLKYRVDSITAAAEIIAAYNTAGVVNTNFTSALNGKRICFELHLASDTNTATPAVTYFQAKGVEKPTTVRIHEAYYSIGDKPSDRAKTIRTLLRTARTSTTLVKFADLRYGQKTSGTSSGDYVWCVMQPGFPKEVEVKHEKGRQPELAIQVRLQEVSFTIS